MTSIIKTRYVKVRPQMHVSNVRPALTKSVLGTCLISVVLTGCEAPLNLEGVDQELQKQVRRTDHFQAVAANDQQLFAVGNDGLMMVSDLSPVNWQRQVIPGEPSFIDIATCPDQSVVALSTDRQIWRSTEGQQWQASSLPTSEDLLDLTCAPDNSLWVVGSFSTMLHSVDAGQNWEEQSLNEDAMITGIQFLQNNQVVATGEFGLVVTSEDGGSSWNPAIYIPNDFYTHAAHFTSLQTGWVGGLSGKILYTQDGGTTWSQQATPTESPIYGFLQADDHLYAFGDHSTVLKFTGYDWQRVALENPPVYLRGALQLPDQTLVFAGGSGSLLTLALDAGDTRLTQK